MILEKDKEKFGKDVCNDFSKRVCWSVCSFEEFKKFVTKYFKREDASQRTCRSVYDVFCELCRKNEIEIISIERFGLYFKKIYNLETKRVKIKGKTVAVYI